jgi:TolB-like protein/DNA-binding winged helix-turn-helix (wHTH) protein/Tfp pilus assembly protein PilF
MSLKTQPAAVLRFGTFEVDLRAEELRKQGVRVKLQEQPFLVLKALLGRPGEIISREELRSQIWSADTFVDFDNSLNTAINKLRDALGDSAENPRFVETVPRRGYRFLPSVSSDVKGTGSKAGAPSYTPTLERRRWVVIGGIGCILIVGLIGVGLSRFGSSRGPIYAIAVMPFGNTSGDPDAEYLSDGIAEGVIDKLSALSNVKVISRTSTFRYKKREIEPRKVARELGVQALVTGSLTQRGDDLWVSAELVDAREDRHLWGEEYSRKLADVASVQQEIAGAITENLQLRLTGAEKKQLAKVYKTSPEAYQLYLRGQYYSGKGTLEGLRKGVEYFEQAIEKDPRYAQAYAGLANCYGDLAGGMAYLPPGENFPKAKTAATKALELDESLAAAHAALGWVEWGYDWDWSSAEREFKRAIELDPDSAVAHGRYASYLVTTGHAEEGIAESKRAQELDPLGQRTAEFLGYNYLGAERYDESIVQLQRAIELDPSAAWLHAELGWAFARKGMYAQAIAEHEKIGPTAYAVSSENQVVASGLGWIYAMAGKRDRARQILTAFDRLSSQSYVDFYQVGAIYAGLGDKDMAFKSLGRAYSERSGSLVYIKTDPFWSNDVRTDPRYADLLQRMRLPR